MVSPFCNARACLLQTANNRKTCIARHRLPRDSPSLVSSTVVCIGISRILPYLRDSIMPCHVSPALTTPICYAATSVMLVEYSTTAFLLVTTCSFLNGEGAETHEKVCVHALCMPAKVDVHPGAVLRVRELLCRCGHCQQLSPKWSQAARALKGIVKVAAVNCEEDKQLCSKHG